MALVQVLTRDPNGQIRFVSPTADVVNAQFVEVNTPFRPNGSGATLTNTQVVYVKSDGTYALARANAAATKNAVGFVKDATIANGASGQIQTSGLLGGFTGLTPGAVYYLSADTAGAITATAPTAPGSFQLAVGIASNATELNISIASGLDILN